jgi:two-component sensor histidine kinase
MSARKTGLARAFAPRMRLISLLMGMAVAVLTPATFFLMNLREQRLEAGFLSKEVANALKSIVRSNPELWTFSATKFVKVFDAVEAERIVRVRIFGRDGILAADEAFGDRALLTATGASNIVYNNVHFGRVEVDKRADSTLVSSLLLFLGFSLAGLASGLALYRFPTAIVRRAEARVDEMLERLDLEVAGRIEEERQLELSLGEKQTLLMEVHHRVKNNLQVIASLVDLKMSRTASPEAKDALDGVKRKIYAMAAVHEELYDRPELGSVEMGPYLESIVAGNGMQPIEGQVVIAYSVAARGIRLPIKLAMPIGLIVSELVMNCQKYAFPGREAGRVEVSLTAGEGGRLELRVEDDGVGAPPEAIAAPIDRLGYILVRSLASQVGGVVEVRSEGGLKVRVSGIGPAA